MNNDLYIGRDEIEFILRNLKMAEVKHANLKKQYDAIKNRTISDAVLLSMAIGNHVLSGMPGVSPEPGRKETAIIDTYRDKLIEIYDDTLEAIEQEMLAIETLVYQFNKANGVLTDKERIVVKEYLINGTNDKDVAKIAGCSRQTVYNTINKALPKLAQAIRIPKHEYALYRGILYGEL